MLSTGGHIARGNGYVDFTVTETVNYAISGTFSGNTADSNETYTSYAYLYSNASFSNLYYEYDQDDYPGSPHTATFALDIAQNGTFFNLTPGSSLTGTLTPGSYRFYGLAQLHDDHSYGGTTTASGFSQLVLTSQSAVPEPATLALWTGLGMLGYFSRRRRGIVA
jgi:hypothetical protein